MESLTTSMDGFSFVNIPVDEFKSGPLDSLVTLKDECDFSFCHNVTEVEATDDLSETLINVNRSLLTELKSEQVKNIKLTENYRQLKVEFDEFKSSNSKNTSLINSHHEQTPLVLMNGKENEIGTNVSSQKSLNSIKEEHLIELNSYLQSELSVCKKEMYAMNSRMVELVGSLKLQRKESSDGSTQTEIEEKQNEIIVEDSSSSTALLNVETQTDLGEILENYSMISVVPDKDIITKKHEDELNSLQTWFSSTYESNLNVIDNQRCENLTTFDVNETEIDQQMLNPNPNIETVLSLSEPVVDSNQPSCSPALVKTTSIPLVSNVVSLDRTVTNLTEPKLCPICNAAYVGNDLNGFEKHVNDHLDGRFCPVCSLNFDGVQQSYFEIHVQSHFGQAIADPTIVDGNFFAHSLFE